MRIDLNADVGEGFETDVALIPLVSSINIACGGHAGDVSSMRQTIRLGVQHQIAIGAHPSYPDREHFGRRVLNMGLDVLRNVLLGQLKILAEIACSEGTRLQHVKPHGALYNQAAEERDLADCVVTTVADFDSTLAIFGLPDSELILAAQRLGLRTVAEAFVDRRYQANGRLVPRTQADAVIDNTEDALGQALNLLQQHRVVALDGQTIAIHADTLCVHGDTMHAVDHARTLRTALEAAGYRIAAPAA